jgi:nitrite reductase (NADH) small subunit
MSWIPIGDVSVLSEGDLRQFSAGNREFAVCRKDGQIHVLDNACPHVGGPLGHGHLDGHRIVCPWHAWSFDCRTGVAAPGIEVRRYPAEIRDQTLFVEVADS